MYQTSEGSLKTRELDQLLKPFHKKAVGTKWQSDSTLPLMNATLYIHKKIIIFKQKNNLQNDLPFQNGHQITDFISRHFDFGENLEDYFSKEIFQ